MKKSQEREDILELLVKYALKYGEQSRTEVNDLRGIDIDWDY